MRIHLFYYLFLCSFFISIQSSSYKVTDNKKTIHSLDQFNSAMQQIIKQKPRTPHAPRVVFDSSKPSDSSDNNGKDKK